MHILPSAFLQFTATLCIGQENCVVLRCVVKCDASVIRVRHFRDANVIPTPSETTRIALQRTKTQRIAQNGKELPTNRRRSGSERETLWRRAGGRYLPAGHPSHLDCRGAHAALVLRPASGGAARQLLPLHPAGKDLPPGLNATPAIQGAASHSTCTAPACPHSCKARSRTHSGIDSPGCDGEVQAIRVQPGTRYRPADLKPPVGKCAKRPESFYKGTSAQSAGMSPREARRAAQAAHGRFTPKRKTCSAPLDDAQQAVGGAASIHSQTDQLQALIAFEVKKTRARVTDSESLCWRGLQPISVAGCPMGWWLDARWFRACRWLDARCDSQVVHNPRPSRDRTLAATRTLCWKNCR